MRPNDAERLLRRRAVIALVIVASVLVGAVWRALHAVRVGREAPLVALCDAALGRSEPDVAADFAPTGTTRYDAGSTVTYTMLTSSWQSFACIASIDHAGVVRDTHVFRMARQETWAVIGSNVPIWCALWPAILDASVSLTP